MPFDGSGGYSPPSAPTFPAVSGAVISSTYYNAVINDISTAFNNTLTRDGQGKPSAAINWNGQNLTNVNTFGVLGAATFAAAVSVGTTLAVTGAVTLSSTLNVSGVATLGGASASVSGTLGVTGAATFGSTVAITTSATIAGSTVWHAGNDGAGSGLDADLLDGAQGSAYALLAGATFTGAVTVNTNLSTAEDNNGLLTVGRFSAGYPYSLVRDSANASGLELRSFAGSTYALMTTALTTLSTPLLVQNAGAFSVKALRTAVAAIKLSLGENSIYGIDTETVDLQLGAGGTERARLTTGGAFGIGTTSPQAPFVVSSNGAAGLEVNTTAVDSSPSLTSYNRSGAAYMQLGYDGLSHKWLLSGSAAMVLSSGGLVGLGTASPALPAGTGMVIYNGGGHARLALKNNVTGNAASDGFQLNVDNGGLAQIVNYENTDMQFYTNGTLAATLAVGGAFTAVGALSDNLGNVRRLIKSGTTSGTIGVAQAGQVIRASAGVTIQDDVFAANDTLIIINKSGGNITITQDTNLTLTDTNGNTGNRTLANHGWATVWFNSTNDACISGTGLS